MGAALELAKYSRSLTFQDLPKDVIHQTKRLVLDTLGCAIGGYENEAVNATQVLKYCGNTILIYFVD